MCKLSLLGIQFRSWDWIIVILQVTTRKSFQRSWKCIKNEMKILMRQAFLKTIKAEIAGERIAATEGMWTKGVGIQIPCKYTLHYMERFL